MTKKLIIAEKPSVATDIARALGGFTRHGDYFESEEHVLSSAIGHLLELVAPEGVEVKRGKWSFANLPVIPPHFGLKPIERTEDRLKLLLTLLKRKDVTGVINACDAGREGELIFRYIMQHAGNKKPIQRLWLQSMTQGAIREGFEGLRTDARALPEDYLPTVKSTMEMLAGKAKGKDKSEGVAAYAPFARQVLKEGWVKPSRRIFDNTKISDHFAIIPTLQAPGNLSDAEAKLYDMVVKRFLAVFFPVAEFLV